MASIKNVIDGSQSQPSTTSNGGNGDIPSIIDSNPDIESTLSNGSTLVIGQPAQGVRGLSDLSDVDIVTEGKLDGSVLVYNVQTNKWVSTKTLDKQLMNGGFF